MEPRKNNFKQKLEQILELARIAVERETEYFFQNLAILLISGIDIKVVLKSLQEELQSRTMKRLTGKILEEIENGSPLWKALADTKILSERYIAIIRIGEESGRLTENLRIIIGQQQKSREFVSRIRTALTYPAIIFFLLAIVGLGIGIFVLPNIARVYNNLHINLPETTKFIINLGFFFEKNGVLAIAGTIIITIIAFFILFVFPKTKFIGQAILFLVPLSKQIIQEIEVGRFAFILGSLLNAGLPVVFALRSLGASTGFVRYQKFYNYLADSINLGKTFQQSFDEYKNINRLVPITMRQMIITGEKTGNLGNLLIEVSAIYDSKSEATMKNLTVALEPVLLIVVWFGVAFFAISIISPIYSLIGNFDNISQKPNVAASPQPTKIPKNIAGTPIVTITPAFSGTPKPTNTTLVNRQGKIIHEKSTVVGVRNEPSPTADIVGKVQTGSIYSIIDERDGWFLMQIALNSTGWIPSQNVEIITN